MKDHEVDSVLGQWAEVSAKAAQIASAEHRRRVRRPTSLGLSISAVTIIAVVVAVLIVTQHRGGESSEVIGGVETSLTPSSTPMASESMAQATNLGATDSASGLAPSPEASASPASEVGDMREAAATAAAFETARASAAWSAAWVMLSAYSQAQYGSESMFAATEASYNAAGGTTFTLANPTRNPDLLDLTFLGAPGADAEAHADFSRAALVFANHPKVRGASEASRAYLIAPVASGVWQIWIVR